MADNPVTSVSISGDGVSDGKLALKAGASAQLTATVRPDNATDRKVTWTSSDSSVANVMGTGVVTAGSKAGTATIWIGNGVLDGSLEDESLFGEFLRTPVSEGGVEPLVVGPPHAVVGAAPRLPDRGVVVPVHELLLQQPIRRLDHGVAVGAAPAWQRSFDVEHVERLVDPRVVEPAAPVGVEHLDVRQREVEGGERGQHQARVPGPPGGMAGDSPVRQAGQQTHVRPVSADADRGKIARQMRVRDVAVEPAVQQVREPGLVDPRPVRFGPSARVRARHALFAHDVADASPGRGDALPFQGGLDLPGAVAFAAVAPDRAHVAGDRIHTLRLGMPDHPVTGGAGAPSIPHCADTGQRAASARITSTFGHYPYPYSFV